MKVVFFQYRLFHYRHRLFNVLREKCALHDIQLDVVFGQPYGDEIKKNDVKELSWGHKVKNIYFPIKEKKDLCWQPTPDSVRDADLFVFMHENRLLANYSWLLKRTLLKNSPRVAFWGHGKDFQSNSPDGFREQWKNKTICWPDWWFAYTDLTKKIVNEAGFPVEKITVVNNAIDNDGFVADLSAVDQPLIDVAMQELGFSADHFIALYCGSLYQDKRIDQLFDVCDLIYESNSSFRLLLIGDGVLRDFVEKSVQTRPWAVYVGPKYGVEKATLFKLAKLILLPGAVGLNVLDSFITGLPLITMRNAKHGPEVGFIEHEVNGLIIEDNINEYAQSVLNLITNHQQLEFLSQNALLAAEKYTVENMAEQFVQGFLAFQKNRVKGNY